VVSAGYSYCVYILNLKDPSIKRPEKHLRNAAVEYKADLEKVWTFTNQTFANIYDTEIEEMDNAKKIHTAWGQLYDIEQLMEHAIVHILRHRRQIEKYKLLLKA
jgi:hypothetical protein